MRSVSQHPIEHRFKLKAVSGCWRIVEVVGVQGIDDTPLTMTWPGLFEKRSGAIRRIEETLKVRLTENQIRKIAY